MRRTDERRTNTMDRGSAPDGRARFAGGNGRPQYRFNSTNIDGNGQGHQSYQRSAPGGTDRMVARGQHPPRHWTPTPNGHWQPQGAGPAWPQQQQQRFQSAPYHHGMPGQTHSYGTGQQHFGMRSPDNGWFTTEAASITTHLEPTHGCITVATTGLHCSFTFSPKMAKAYFAAAFATAETDLGLK